MTFNATEAAAGDTRAYAATLRNDGTTTYYDDSGCGADWDYLHIKDQSGHLVFPTIGATCDACPWVHAFPPGEVLERTWTWDGTDGNKQGDPRAAPGTYTTNVASGALFVEPEHEPCRHPGGVRTSQTFTFTIQ